MAPRGVDAEGEKKLSKREWLRRQVFAEIDAEVREERTGREPVPLERAPANGEYHGAARVRVLPPGSATHAIDDPGRLGVRKATFTRNRRI